MPRAFQGVFLSYDALKTNHDPRLSTDHETLGAVTSLNSTLHLATLVIIALPDAQW